MPKMIEKPNANRTEPDEVLRLLKNARPDQVEATELPDGSFTIHFIPEKPIPTPKEKGKWAKVAEKLAEENLLRDGLGDELREHARRFRETFVLK
jgi:hypothetical protein